VSGPPWDRAALVLLLTGCAVVPCVFATSITDVFYLPKLIALWCLLAAVSLSLVVSILRDEDGPRLEWIGVVDWPLAAFVVLILAALATSTDRRQSLFGEGVQHQGVLTTILYAAFFFVARSLVRDVARLRLVFVAVATGATTVAAYAIVQKLGLDPIWSGRLPSGRVFSTVGQANALAAYLVLAIPITAALALTSTRLARVAALVALSAMAGSLLFTYSRGGYVGCALAAVVLVYGVRDRIELRWAVVRAHVGPALVAVALVVALAAPAARSAISGLWQEVSRESAVNDDSRDDHLDLWRVAIRIIERHPLVGTGPETFPEQFVRYSPDVLPPARIRYFEPFRVESPHNQLLAVAAGAGIPAAVAYVGVLAGIARTLWRRVRSAGARAEQVAIVALVAAGAGHLVTDSFMSAEVTGSWLFWTLAGAGVGIASIGTADIGAGGHR
jgi:putative inorganic carbon (HCO3(-)) transporter